MSYVPFPLHEIANYKIQEPNKSEILILKSEKNIQDIKQIIISNLELIWFLRFGSWYLGSRDLVPGTSRVELRR